jgi:hypothetical protein
MKVQHQRRKTYFKEIPKTLTLPRVHCRTHSGLRSSGFQAEKMQGKNCRASAVIPQPGKTPIEENFEFSGVEKTKIELKKEDKELHGNRYRKTSPINVHNRSATRYAPLPFAANQDNNQSFGSLEILKPRRSEHYSLVRKPNAESPALFSIASKRISPIMNLNYSH